MNRQYKTNRKGFTLAELLIVVAIIGVLVAISIPIFSSQLRKARVAVDQANVRSAKAAAAAEYMSDGESGLVSYLYDGSTVIAVNPSTVDKISSITSSAGYGKSDIDDSNAEETGAKGKPKNAFVEVNIRDAQSDQITARWVSGATIFNSENGDLILTGNVISNGTIIKQISDMGINPNSIKTITAAEGSTIDENTENVFQGLDNLEKVDLSNATLEQSSYHMFSRTPKSLKEIILPKSEKSYNIIGDWYDSTGKRLDVANWAPEGKEYKKNYSRVYMQNETGKKSFHAGDAIYTSPEYAPGYKK